MTAETLATAPEDVLERVEREDVRLVDLQFSDIAGGARVMTIPGDLLPSVLRHGYRFDGSAVTGGQREVELDLFLVPDPATLVTYPEPTGIGRRARFACSVRRRDGQPFAGDPRSVLERNLVEAREAGFDYRVAIELEYYLFSVDNAGLPPTDVAGYFGTGPGLGTPTRDAVVASLAAMGVRVGGAHHETGPGQEELDLRTGGALEMADTVLTVREVIRAVAERHGLRANFMPKPLADAPGSGMHIFQRLHRIVDGADALRGEGESISLQARHAIAGQLHHARGMSAIVCPTVNSYKRLAAGHRAPRHATWARLSQASLIRVPASGQSTGSTVELELRSPDNMANPYLALSVALASAIDGIRRQEEPPLALDENLVRYDEAELMRLGVPALPQTLGDALNALAEDDLIRTSLGDYVCDQFMLVKRAEWADYRRYVSPWERERYGS
ncbi:MAG: glutamine synthetase family protein [Thermomicrobiales bacterium]